MAGVAAAGGWIALEHPKDPNREPFPSFFHSSFVISFVCSLGASMYICDQCRFGACSCKPSQLISNSKTMQSIQKFCNHPGGHPWAVGKDPQLGFKTKPLEKYPSAFSRALATGFINGLIASRAQGATPWSGEGNAWHLPREGRELVELGVEASRARSV